MNKELMLNTLQQNSRNDRLQLAMEMIESAQKAGLADSNPDHAYIKAMREFFECDGCIFIIPNHVKRELATKKEISAGSRWRITSDVPFKAGMLWGCLGNNELIEINEPFKSPDYDQHTDGLNSIKSTFLVCNVIQSHLVKFGVLALVNPKNYFMDTQDKFLFQLFCTALAGQLHATNVLAELQVKDADLQVSRMELLHSRNILRTIFDHLPDSLFIVDTSYRIKAINKSRADRTGKSPRELVGKKCYEVFYGADNPCAECLVADTVRQRAPQRALGCHNVAEDNDLEWDISSYPVINSEQQVELVVLFEQDITEKRKLEAELNQSQKLVAVGQLAAGVAHEINNPLTAILANTQLLRLDLPPDQVELMESVQLIEMAAERAKKVVENLQNIVRKEDYEYRPVDLNESIQSSLQLVSHEFISRKITIRFNGGEDMPNLIASGDHLQGVWINLLLNAIESIENEPGEIKIDTLYDEGNFYVEIKDTGVGIREQDLDKIFTPFFSTKKSGKGTGLGLSLAWRIVHSHAGQILVESAPGEGARFTIILPERSQEDIKKSRGGELDLI